MACCAPAGHDHLPSDEGELVVVDPDLVTTVKSDGVTAPDELRVQFLLAPLLEQSTPLGAQYMNHLL